VAGYVPHHRLQRGDIRGVLGKGGGKGTRSVASYDEDTTTMAVEAGRLALRGAPGAAPDRLWFATSAPAYLDKTNATAIHAALRLDSGALAMDAGGAIRSGVGALRSALDSSGTTLVVSADLRSGRPSSAEEASGGDGASAALVGDGDVIAEYLGGASVTDEFTERWRGRGDRHTRTWEDRFGESVYPDLGRQAWEAALKAASLEADAVSKVAVHSQNARAAGRMAKALGGVQVEDDLSATVGNTATAHAGLLLATMVESAEPGEVLALVSLVDGADVLLFRATDAVSSASVRPVAAQVAAAADLSYGTFLAWRGEIELEPPTGLSRAGRPPPWPTGARTGSSPSRARGTRRRALCTCRRLGWRSPTPTRTTWTRPRWPTSRPPSPPSRSTAWPTRPARRSSSASSTSTGAGASPAS